MTCFDPTCLTLFHDAVNKALLLPSLTTMESTETPLKPGRRMTTADPFGTGTASERVATILACEPAVAGLKAMADRMIEDDETGVVVGNEEAVVVAGGGEGDGVVVVTL